MASLSSSRSHRLDEAGFSRQRRLSNATGNTLVAVAAVLVFARPWIMEQLRRVRGGGKPARGAGPATRGGGAAGAGGGGGGGRRKGGKGGSATAGNNKKSGKGAEKKEERRRVQRERSAAAAERRMAEEKARERAEEQKLVDALPEDMKTFKTTSMCVRTTVADRVESPRRRPPRGRRARIDHGISYEPCDMVSDGLKMGVRCPRARARRRRRVSAVGAPGRPMR